MYTVKKSLNSSVVLVEDAHGQEFILLGKGIGYGQKPGSPIQPTASHQVFMPVEDARVQAFIAILQDLDPTYVDVTDTLLQEAQTTLSLSPSPTLFFALLDHLQFAVSRYYQGLLVPNKVHWEIQTYYRAEYDLGLHGLQLLQDHFQVTLPADEAANIAFHFINAQAPGRSSHGLQAAKLVNDLVNVTRYSLGLDWEPDSLHYARLITHLKFFVERYLTGRMLDGDDDSLYHYLTRRSPQAVAVAERIDHFVQQQYGHPITREEIVYLAVHFQRLLAG